MEFNIIKPASLPGNLQKPECPPATSIKASRFGSRDPSDRRMLMRMRFAITHRADKRDQFNGDPGIGMPVVFQFHLDQHVDAEFFPQFPDQGRFRHFSLMNFTAGELPESRIRLQRPALGGKEPVAPFDDGADDNDRGAGGAHCSSLSNVTTWPKAGK